MATKTNQAPKGFVHRFNPGFIVSHWVQAATFFLLLFTGLPLWTEYFDFLYFFFGGPDMASLLHKIFGVLFLLPLIILIFFDREGLRNWAKEIFTWQKHDLTFFLHFPKEFFVGSDKIPKQGFLNGGEKLNSWGSILTTILLIVTGFIIWASDVYTGGLVHWAQLFHVVGFVFGTIFALGHIFLSAFHPNSKPSMSGITKGYIPIEYAKDHHGRWYDQLVAQGVIKEEETIIQRKN